VGKSSPKRKAAVRSSNEEILPAPKKMPPKRRTSLTGGRRGHKKQGSKSEKGTVAPELSRASRAAAAEKQLVDTANLEYEGELADRASAVAWFYRSLGSPEGALWGGPGGTVSEICRQMRLPVANYRAHVQRVLNRLVHGKNVRQRDFQDVLQPRAVCSSRWDICTVGWDIHALLCQLFTRVERDSLRRPPLHTTSRCAAPAVAGALSHAVL
jgi:hypothetical protein